MGREYRRASPPRRHRRARRARLGPRGPERVSAAHGPAVAAAAPIEVANAASIVGAWLGSSASSAVCAAAAAARRAEALPGPAEVDEQRTVPSQDAVDRVVDGDLGDRHRARGMDRRRLGPGRHQYLLEHLIPLDHLVRGGGDGDGRACQHGGGRRVVRWPSRSSRRPRARVAAAPTRARRFDHEISPIRCARVMLLRSIALCSVVDDRRTGTRPAARDRRVAAGAGPSRRLSGRRRGAAAGGAEPGPGSRGSARSGRGRRRRTRRRDP